GNQLNVDAQKFFTTFLVNQQTAYYAICATNSNLSEGFSRSRLGNPQAEWEKNINSNIGIDASLFNHTVQLTVDYYKKTVEDLLYNPNLPATIGTATVPYINVGEMKTSGVDIDDATLFNLTDDLRLNTTLTFTSYDNEIVKITDELQYFDLEGRRFNGSTIIRNAEGHAVSEFFGYEIEGFWDSTDEINQANAAAAAATGNANATYQN